MEPWDPSTLGTCRDRKPAHQVPYPFNGANCIENHYEEPVPAKDGALM